MTPRCANRISRVKRSSRLGAARGVRGGNQKDDRLFQRVVEALNPLKCEAFEETTLGIWSAATCYRFESADMSAQSEASSKFYWRLRRFDCELLRSEEHTSEL